MDALEVSNLSYAYEDRKVLDNVTFSVEEGEIITILGPNGAGKTTLFLNLVGILKGEGEIKLFGKKIEDYSRKELVKTIGMVFQNPDDQIFMPTVFDEIAFGLINLGFEKNEIVRRVNVVLEKFGLEGYKDRYPHHLSFGEKKKVAIASAICTEPRILLLDEPTANLDPVSREELIEIIRDLNDDGMTILIATHDTELALQSDKTIILNREIVKIGKPKDVFLDLDLLRQNGLDAPQIVKLFMKLGLKIPQSLDEAVEIIKRELDANRHNS
ncbi:energy-coupling factor ABC transporter ATP-binding protein [Archaeoglobus profundus]|uniref:ABC transporter ATP-binding protein n=1 Tax=Archaeoglobus profundus (strain DSM 5631 / JCM 9629 / NBRC 100127 / Av18) TaxID=572546 RepID=D2RGQ8_ARCPA|nr:ABC transporter ATP-binding protein [Archaeoglobus profundus]ADB57483.1 cobalt ABC transporter, ATPase subunit [Archaeoglobus profundus DSM 5631]